ncbi:MAG: 50S ribosomal protein L21 [Spirochaetales bacterium]|nr:50S ribosomal protein L21 [Spirochaetales bacterium]MCF7937986.1 50S ribosomal protein L21 [Spirochaetales bacterium]
MYALVEIKGKQYKAEKGKTLKVDRLENQSGDNVEFDSVMLLRKDDDVSVGTPYVKGVSVKATVGDTLKDEKIIVYKYKKRKGYRRKQGHRQQYTMLTVDDIVGV